jgi:hypothetical protein
LNAREPRVFEGIAAAADNPLTVVLDIDGTLVG